MIMIKEYEDIHILWSTATCNEASSLLMNVDSWIFHKCGKQNRNEEEQREDKTGGKCWGKRNNMRKSTGGC